jgi:hypothetical protein
MAPRLATQQGKGLSSKSTTSWDAYTSAEDAGQQLPHPYRLSHATSPGSETTRRPGACSANSTPGSARNPAVARIMAAT